MLLPNTTSQEVAAQGADVAVLPVGSFEQHGGHLPLATDALIATAISERLAQDYELFLLPPLTFGCSDEHFGFSGTVSIRASTLYAVVGDIFASLHASGVRKLVVVNGHGGNYVLNNVVQEASVNGASMALFPRPDDWADARKLAGLVTDNHEDMHGGESETSILLQYAPSVVRPSYRESDHIVNDRRNLLVTGMKALTPTGIIGRPSLASADKGKRLLEALSDLFGPLLTLIRQDGE